MAGSLIGALRVSLGLDSAQFDTGVKKAQKSAKQGAADISHSFQNISNTAKALGALITATLGASVVMAIRESANAMDELSKAAQKTGTTVPELAKLQWAADLSAVSSDKLQKALNKLNVAIVDVGPSATGAAGALHRMGVTAGTSTLNAMMKVADQFAGMRDGAEKSALAIKIFGRTGADLIPLLNGGAAGLKAAADEAQRLGIVIDGNTARAAEAFNDNLSRLGKVAGGITTQITAGLVPSLAAFTNEMARSASVGGGFVDLGKGIGQAMLTIGENGFIAYEAIAGVVNATLSLKRAAAALYDGKGFAEAGRIIGDQERATKAGIKAREESFRRMRAEIAKFTPGEMTPIGLPGDFNAGDSPKPTTLKVDIDFVAPADQQGWALKALLDGGTPAVIDLNNQSLRSIFDTMRDLQNTDFSTDIIRPQAFAEAERFAENLSQSLGQALVFGQSLGDALVNSFKAAAAEMVTSGLMDLLLGSRGADGQRSGGMIGSLLGIPGFANGTNFAPGGLAMVGERGRELVNLPRGSQVISNGLTEAMMRPVESRISVGIDPANGNVTAFVDGRIVQAAPAVANMGAMQSQAIAGRSARRRVR